MSDYLVLYPQCLAQCLAHGQWWKNIYWINKSPMLLPKLHQVWFEKFLPWIFCNFFLLSFICFVLLEVQIEFKSMYSIHWMTVASSGVNMEPNLSPWYSCYLGLSYYFCHAVSWQNVWEDLQQWSCHSDRRHPSENEGNPWNYRANWSYSSDSHVVMLDPEWAIPKGLFICISQYIHLNAYISFDGIFLRIT